MTKHIRILTSIAVGTVFLSASPAIAGVPAYNTIYYSDSTLQHQVGTQYWSGCRTRPWGDEVVYHTTGTQTIYYTRELAGYCQDGEMMDP